MDRPAPYPLRTVEQRQQANRVTARFHFANNPHPEGFEPTALEQRFDSYDHYHHTLGRV